MNRSPTESWAGAFRSARPLASAALALLAVAIWPGAALARKHAISHQTSANCAGYAVTASMPSRSVSGRWTAPAPVCHQPFSTYSAFWVRLAGFTRSLQALEQIGSEADCAPDGRPDIYAWYEVLPVPAVKLKLPVRPGDLRSASVFVHGLRVRLQIQSLRTGRQFAKIVSMRRLDTSSAEWIAEAPSSCASAEQCRTLPLTDFGTVRFTHTRASAGRRHTGTITSPAFTTTELTFSGGARMLGPGFVTAISATAEASPRDPIDRGGTFSVAFKQATTPVLAVPFAAPDRLRHTARVRLNRSLQADGRA